ncbi:MAG: GH3 auxin-responsive promoter family protein [Ruminococcaceae bacterium]|nr:GH3 auxin-responsive promoter family protein [Oscillospiraceae bacterium]
MCIGGVEKMGSDFFWRKTSQFGGLLGNLVYTISSRYTADPMPNQQQLLLSLMKKNADTEYGKKYNFKDITTFEEYQDNVPITDYDDYEPFIDRMIAGEQNLITYKKIKNYIQTSGSAGKPKLIPLCGKAVWNFQIMGFCAPLAATLNYYKKQGLPMPGQHSFLTIEVINRDLPNGNKASCLSAIPFNLLRPIAQFFSVTPKAILYPEQPEETDMNYLKLRFALENPSVTALTAALVMYLVSMFEYLEKNWQVLVEDIEKGTISESVRCPEELRKQLLKKCRPNPQRAAQLRAEFEKGFDTPIGPRIWPDLAWTSAMRGGSLAVYAGKLKKYCGDLPFNNTGYAASESLMAMPLEMSALDAVLLPKSCLFEFLPVDAPAGTRPLLMDQLEVGKEYEVIITNLAGLYRYRMYDVVRVTGFYQKTPKVEFLYRSNLVLNITGEKTTQQMLDWAVEKACTQVGLPYSRFCAYGSMEDGKLPYYNILIEPKDDSDVDLTLLADALDKAFCDSNLYIDVRRREDVLGKTQVHLLQKGTFDAYTDSLRQQGINISQVKPVTILNTNERQEFFLSHITH